MTFRMTLLATAALTSTAWAQDDADEAAFGGQSGADLTIEAIEPTDEPISVGLAGEDPADIGRYLLASGARGAQISPDGEKIAFYWSITGETQVWVMDAEGGQPRRLTYGSGVTFFRWAPDGETLIYGADNDGNEQPAYYRIAADGSSEAVVLPPVAGGFRAFGDFAADSDMFVYASTERNGLDFDIWRASLSGEAEMVYEGEYAFIARSMSPDGQQAIVTEAVGEDSDNLHVLDMDSGELTILSAPDPRANHGDAGFAWARDGSGFYFATNRDREFAALQFFDVETGEMSMIQAPGGADVANLALCGENGRRLAYTVNRDGFHELFIHNTRNDRSTAVEGLPEGVYGLDCASKSDQLVVSVNGWSTPGDIFVVDAGDGEATRVFAADLAGLDQDRLVRPESIRITARDGVELQGLLYTPDDSSRSGDGPAPIMFNVHGGPTAQSQASWDGTAQYLVDRGIAVFEPNVRGSTGFGRTYVTLDDQEKRLDSVRDLVDMLAHFEDDPRIDADRAAVRGGSYGGYMVNAVLGAYPDAFAAGVSLFGVGDWVTALEIASPGLKASDRIEYGDISDPDVREFHASISPINQADQIQVPVLFSHGVMDPRIDIAETEIMVKTLRANGVEARFIRIPDEGHGWRKLKNQLFYYRREAEFLEEVLAE